MEDASTRRTHTHTPPGATASAGGGLAHTHHPTRHLLNTTPCCAHAASHTPRWLRCKALLQQQIFIAAALLYNAPHNTQASCASALTGQMPALPPANLHAALSVAPGRGALLFALLCAHHDAMLVARFVAQRHSRADHLPQHEFRARLQAQVHRLLVRAHCLLLPARQQTSHTTNGSLTHGSHHPPHPSSCSASAR
jgi:hypothetical protein